MNTLSLSVSNPRRAKGSSLRISLSTSVNSRCSRTSSGAHSVHPVAMSVNTRVCTKLPFATGPLCATRSASTKPGGGLSQPSNVRTGTLRLATRRSTRLLPDVSQGPVDRGRAHRQQADAHLRREPKMAMPLHCLDQNGHQRPQPLAADPVRRLPNHDQCFPCRVLVDPAPGPRSRTPLRLTRPKQPHHVLAVKAGNRRELVEDAAPLCPVRLRIPSRYRCYQLVPRRHADPPHP